jgi:hypothetical protein
MLASPQLPFGIRDGKAGLYFEASCLLAVAVDELYISRDENQQI